MSTEKEVFEKLRRGYRQILDFALGAKGVTLTEAHRPLFFSPSTEHGSAPALEHGRPSGIIAQAGRSAWWKALVYAVEESGLAPEKGVIPEDYLAFLFLSRQFLRSRKEDRHAQQVASYLEYLLSWNGDPWTGYFTRDFGGLQFALALVSTGLGRSHTFRTPFGGWFGPIRDLRGRLVEMTFSEKSWGYIRSFFHPLVFHEAIESVMSDQDDKDALSPRDAWAHVQMEPSQKWIPLCVGSGETITPNISSLDLSGAWIRGWYLKHRSAFFGAKFSGCLISDTQFVSPMNKVVFEDCKGTNISFSASEPGQIRGYYDGCSFRRCSFRNGYIKSLVMSSCSIEECVFRGFSLTRLGWLNMRFDRSLFSGQFIDSTRIANSTISRTIFDYNASTMLEIDESNIISAVISFDQKHTQETGEMPKLRMSETKIRLLLLNEVTVSIEDDDVHELANIDLHGSFEANSIHVAKPAKIIREKKKNLIYDIDRQQLLGSTMRITPNGKMYPHKVIVFHEDAMDPEEFFEAYDRE